MSRYSGCWIAFKTVAETMDSSASVSIDPGRLAIVLPEDFEMPPGGLNIRWPDAPLDQEYRLHRYKVAAAHPFTRTHRLHPSDIHKPHHPVGRLPLAQTYSL